MDGNQIKRFNSGGDELCVRKNFKDETYFRTQAHQLICCNDLCDVMPCDAKERGILFDMPTKFVAAGHPNLKAIQKNTHQIVYKRANDDVKSIAQLPEIIDAWTWAVIDQYKQHAVEIPKIMQESNDEFRTNDGGSENEVFHEQFVFTGRPNDRVSVKDIKDRVRKLKLAVTAQRYNKWLRAQQCACTKNENQRCWTCLEMVPLEDDDNS